MKRIRQLAFWNLLSFVAQLTYAYLSQIHLGDALTVKEVSDRYDTLFTPAPVTFSIWGLIYTGLTVFAIVHLVAAWRHGSNHYYNRETDAAGPWFIWVNLFSLGWFYLFTHEAMLGAEIFIVLQLVAIGVINRRLGIYDRSVSLASKLITQIPFSFYLGWLSVATIANTSLYLKGSRWWTGYGLENITWVIIAIALATLLAVIIVTTRKNVWYGLVFVWGLFGILLARQADGNENYNVIIQITWTAIGIIGMVCILQLIQNLMNREQPHHHPYPTAAESLK